MVDKDAAKTGKTSTKASAGKKRPAANKAKSGARPSKDKTQEHANDGASTAIYRERALVDDLKKPLSWLMWTTIGVLVIVLALTIFAASRDYDVAYIAANEDNQLIELVHLSEPNMSDEAVGNWAVRALVDTWQFNYANIDQRLNESFQQYFTDAGAQALAQELEQSGNREQILRNNLIVELNVPETPMILRSGTHPDHGRHAWLMQMPVTVTFRIPTGDPGDRSERTITNDGTVTLTVIRESMVEDPQGLAIDQFGLELG